MYIFNFGLFLDKLLFLYPVLSAFVVVQSWWLYEESGRWIWLWKTGMCLLKMLKTQLLPQRNIVNLVIKFPDYVLLYCIPAYAGSYRRMSHPERPCIFCVHTYMYECNFLAYRLIGVNHTYILNSAIVFVFMEKFLKQYSQILRPRTGQLWFCPGFIQYKSISSVAYDE